MSQDLIASASTTIDAPAERVWDALVRPEKIKRYMFGTDVTSTWRKGDAITWKGEWEGRAYEDKGKVLDVEPNALLRYSHYSPLSGAPDTPENYHTVAIKLTSEGAQTRVTLTQDHNPTEEARQHSEKNWSAMLAGLKKFVETEAA